MRPIRRQLILLIALVMAAGACTDSTGSSTTTSLKDPITTGVGTAEGIGTAMDNALGGTQAVQDFVIHIGMSVQTDDGPVSFYQEVLDRAGSGAGEPVDLAGGFRFAAVDSIEGSVVDTDDRILPTLSLYFGLLTVGGDTEKLGSEDLADEINSIAGSEVAAAVYSADPSEASLLVELVTADYTEARTHAGPGDRSEIDLTFVSNISPGDQLTSIHIFGQTLPGDPNIERELSPQELFTYRWNQGLIRILSGEDDARFVVDATVEAIAGSTLATREIKADLLNELAREAYLRRSEELIENLKAELDDGPVLVSITEDGPIALAQGQHGEVAVVIGGDNPGPLNEIDPEELIASLAILKALEDCREAAEYLNMRNQSGGILVSELRDVEHRDETSTGDESAGDSIGTTTSSTTPKPGPVSCHPPEDTPLPPLPSGGAWGDPHIRTIDGNFYDNMATGEFLAFDNGVAAIQIRTEPWPGEDSVSLSTAVAFRVGEHTVSVHTGGSTWIDDEPAQLTRGATIAVDDAELLRWEGGWVLVWPDGTVARVYLRASALILVVTPSDRSAVGLLGDNDGNPDNDLVTRSGDQLDADADADFETFYPTYIDSWRITDDESLFHYEPGENTATFTVEGFPATRTDASNLDPDARSDAEDICSTVGVTGDQLFESCVLDVGLTGDTSLAYDTFVIQASNTTSGSGGDEDTTPVGPSVDGGSIISFGNLTVEFGEDPPTQDPNGVRPKWQCQVTDGSFHATSKFDESPTRKYEVNVEYLDAVASGTGQERFTLIIKRNAVDYAWVVNWVEHFSDAVDTISLERTTLRATGSVFVNDELSPAMSPFAQLPPDADLKPFAMETTCDQ